MSTPLPFRFPTRCLVLTLDGLNASYLGPYGNTWVGTRTWNQLASHSLLLEQCFTGHTDLSRVLQDWWSPASASSTPWSQFPGGARLISDSTEVLEAGRAVGFTEVTHLNEPLPTSAAAEIEDTLLVRQILAACDQLSKSGDGGLDWIHLSFGYGPWDAPQVWREALMDEDELEPPTWLSPERIRGDVPLDADDLLRWQVAYGAQIRVLDVALEVLLDQLEWPLASECLLMLTAPRGMNLGSHGSCFDPAPLWNANVQVPFLLASPEPIGFRTQALSGPIDLGDLLRAMASGSEAAVAETVLARARDNPAYQWRDRWLIRSSDSSEVGLRTQRWYLRRTADGRQTLYLKPDDRHEVNEISTRLPDVTQDLGAVLDQLLGLTPDITTPLPLPEFPQH